MKKIITLFLLTFFLILPTINAIPSTPDHPDYDLCESDHLENPSPDCFEEDIVIGPKGVQTCIDIIIDLGCTANITMYWYNWTYAIETYGEEAAFRTPFPDAWVEYYYEDGIAASQTICAWDENVSCRTENWWTEWTPIFITAQFNCSGNLYNESIMLVFIPEECPNFNYIEPAYNESVCPCCDSMCIGVNNTDGNPMNLTFYRAEHNGSDPEDLDYYQVKEYTYVTNDTYCFCIDGHFDSDTKLYIPVGYNESYHWYVNMTDTVTGTSLNSDYFFFYTCDNNSDCPCGGDELIEYISEEGGCRGEIVSSPGFETLMFMTSLILIGFILYKKKK